MDEEQSPMDENHRITARTIAASLGYPFHQDSDIRQTVSTRANLYRFTMDEQGTGPELWVGWDGHWIIRYGNGPEQRWNNPNEIPHN